MTLSCPFEVLGVVRTSYHSTETTPIQSSLNRTEHATVEFDERYADALTGLDGFDYAWLITWLDRPHDQEDEPVPLRQVPFLLRPWGTEVGLFAMRGPRRINPIGLSLVRVVEVDGRVLRFSGVDMLDQTPVIDVKPYVTSVDRPPGEPRCGWFDTVRPPEGITPSQLKPRE